jgi:GT2 family glycosyltransferase
MRFAAFIMTYERPDVLPGTINALLTQTVPPDEILIVDNSKGDETKTLIETLSDDRISYYRVGYNSGPAGAAKIGLQKLAEKNYDWIYWGDDNDPPRDKAAFERLLQLASTLPMAGAVGSIGGKLNKVTGRTRNLTNRELGGLCEVDYIPGGKDLVINGSAVRQGVLPSEELFFGFEELEYCLRLKKAGFRIYVDGERWLKSRIQAGNVDPDYRWQGKSFNKPVSSRHYYSARNMLYILLRNRLYLALVFNLAKTLFKSIAGFRFGFSHGARYFEVHMLALIHFLSGKKNRLEKELISQNEKTRQG